MEWIIILAGIAFWVILIIVKRYSYKKQEAEGILVDRPTRFAESGEEFTAKVGSVDELDKAISGMLIPKGVSVQTAKNNESIRFDFISTYFAAVLYSKETNNDQGKSIYRFEFLKWKEGDFGYLSGDKMNALLTSVEKTFMSIDPETRSTFYKMDFKIKTSLF